MHLHLMHMLSQPFSISLFNFGTEDRVDPRAKYRHQFPNSRTWMQLQLQSVYTGVYAGAATSNVKTSVSATEGERKRACYFHLKWALQTGLQ